MSTVDPRRRPDALANAITTAWRPYRWRANGVALLAGMMAAGVVAPIVTSSVELALALALSTPPARWPWWEVAWSGTFVAAVPWIGATLFVRWQPRGLRHASETYLWLGARAEDHWHGLFGARPVPRDPAHTRAFLATVAETAETAGERFGLWLALLDLEQARRAAALMPTATANDRFSRAAALWLCDFTEGTSSSVDPLDPLAEAIAEPAERQEAAVTLAVNRARVALAQGAHWQAPLTAARPLLGDTPFEAVRQFVWRPVWRSLTVWSTAGMVIYWGALLALTGLTQAPPH